ncbi:MAG: hypothetical protein QM780_17205 [Hyphomicrobium sp.]|uniref:hypothetical protein n=1 Tax=Hyphomicrobium sp. TaxID=82 RepID=UPI0039E5A79F
MREDTRQKLDAVAQSERSRERLALAVGAGLVALVGIYCLGNSYPLSEPRVSGEVRWAVWKYEHDTGERYPDIQVLLTDGRLVRATTYEHDLPAVGSNVELKERIWAWGPVTYRWDRQTGQTGKP